MNPSASRGRRATDWAVRLAVAGILIQTLWFKFSGASESIYIFTQTGMEPLGRYASGTAELIASLLLLRSRTVVYGAAIALGVISGALFFHLTTLGIVVQDDGGLLFALALIVFAGSSLLLWLHRRSLPVVGSRFP